MDIHQSTRQTAVMTARKLTNREAEQSGMPPIHKVYVSGFTC